MEVAVAEAIVVAVVVAAVDAAAGFLRDPAGPEDVRELRPLPLRANHLLHPRPLSELVGHGVLGAAAVAAGNVAGLEDCWLRNPDWLRQKSRPLTGDCARRSQNCSCCFPPHHCRPHSYPRR